MDIKALRDTHAFEIELLSPENRLFAASIIQRLRAFHARWYKEYDRTSDSSKAANKAKHLLKAIGGEITYIPQGSTTISGKFISEFIIALKSPLGLNNLQILETSESLYAKISRRLNMLEHAVTCYPEQIDAEHYDENLEPEPKKADARGVLIHALQMRVALATRNRSHCLIPVCFTPMAARCLSAVLLNRNAENWRRKYKDFWWCTVEEYRQKTNLEAGLSRFCKITNQDLVTGLNEVVSYGVDIDLVEDNDEKYHISIIDKAHEISVKIRDWMKNDTIGTAIYTDARINLMMSNVPESAQRSLPGKSLDDFIDHWQTKKTGAIIETVEIVTNSVTNSTWRMTNIGMKAGPGPVLFIKTGKDQKKKVGELCDPQSLRLLKRSDPS